MKDNGEGKQNSRVSQTEPAKNWRLEWVDRWADKQVTLIVLLQFSVFIIKLLTNQIKECFATCPSLTPEGGILEIWSRGLLLRVDQSLYNQSRSLVFISRGKSNVFRVDVELRQRCPLSLVLFIYLMNRLFKCREGLVWGPQAFISTFCMWFCSMSSLNQDFQCPQGKFTVAGMKINSSESEAMVLDRGGEMGFALSGESTFPKWKSWSVSGSFSRP